MKLSNEELGKRYATALYDFASDHQLVPAIKEEIDLLAEVLHENAAFLQVFASPSVRLDKKKNFIDALGNHFSREFHNFLQLMFEYDRMEVLPFVVTAFNARFDSDQKIGRGEVISATKMTDAQLEQLAGAYAKMNGLNDFHLENTVDSSLLGGVVLKTDGKVIDGSIRTKIATLRSNLINNI